MSAPAAPGDVALGASPSARRPGDATGSAARLALLIPGGVALLLGLDAALLLLGLPAPVTLDRLPDVHGPLMVFGFIGTLISLERAVAMRRWWGYLSPALLGLGGILMITSLPPAIAQSLVVAGFGVQCLLYVAIWRRQAAAAIAIQSLGAVLVLASGILWLGGVPVATLVPSITGYLVLTIVGERVELARIVRLSRRALLLVQSASLGVTMGVLASLLWPEFGHPLLGVSLLGVIVWLLRYDVATRLVRARGLPRYIAICLLAGYVWLAVASVAWVFAGATLEGAAYDAVLHAVFLGFTMSMIMAHAPVILPAVLRRPLPYRPMLYIPVALLHVSLVARIGFGDGLGAHQLVTWGGATNVAAVLLFVVLAAASAIMGPPKRTAKNAAQNAAQNSGQSRAQKQEVAG
ncbi:hypothetical protein FB562_2464 [Homoserinimonas aerilata]|uniref:Uncharacterized protein n=1 Tax=Homoserinimonas aerilata TaxID=1162970 RepID=A0A542YAL5_9MICO|nr:hypothetical protein [Homoserinimonas aerilata]TQL45052.1 hypothetical protein FB562_2464 [Homoserinimonas aerilata]